MVYWAGPRPCGKSCEYQDFPHKHITLLNSSKYVTVLQVTPIKISFWDIFPFVPENVGWTDRIVSVRWFLLVFTTQMLALTAVNLFFCFAIRWYSFLSKSIRAILFMNLQIIFLS